MPFYERIARKKGSQKAVVARKMLVSIWYVLTRNELYDGNRAELTERKLKNLKRIAAQ
jgi:hypothetical protein